MIRSSACRQWHADQSGPVPESTATNAVSYTTSVGTIHGHLPTRLEL